MHHGIFALLNQTLRTDSRKLSVHLFLLFFVGFLEFVLLVTVEDRGFRSAAGLFMFEGISWINFWFILLASGSYFSAAISEEKEDDTLGLLKMTGMSPLVLLLGKSTSRLLFALLLLSVQFPFTMLAITLGGVTFDQVIAMYVALASFTILLANLGLFCSLLTRTTAASGGVIVVMLILLPACWMLGSGILSEIFRYTRTPSTTLIMLKDFLNFLYDCTIYARIFEILSSGFSSSVWSTQVWTNLLGGGLLFGASWLLFERYTKETGKRTFTTARYDIVKNFRFLRSRYVGRTWTESIFWKDFHFQTGGYSAFILKFCGYGLLFCVPAVITLVTEIFFGRNNQYPDYREIIGYCFLIGAIYILLFEAVYQSSVMFKREIREQTWSVLVMSPHSLGAITRSKMVAALYSLVPAFFYLLLGAAIVPEGVHEFLTDLLFNRFVDFCACTMIALCYLAFVLLVNYVSLFFKWGVITISGGIAFGIGTCFVGVVEGLRLVRNNDEALVLFVCTSIILLLVGILLFKMIRKRLVTITAQ